MKEKCRALWRRQQRGTGLDWACLLRKWRSYEIWGGRAGNARLQAVGRTEFKLQGRAELLLFEKEKGGRRVRAVWWNQWPSEMQEQGPVRQSLAKFQKHQWLCSSSDCLGVCQGLLRSWPLFFLLRQTVYFSISSLLKLTLAKPATGKPGRWTVLVKPETQVLECLEQQWWGHL